MSVRLGSTAVAAVRPFFQALLIICLSAAARPVGLPANASPLRIQISSARPAFSEHAGDTTEARITALLDEALAGEFRALGFTVSKSEEELVGGSGPAEFILVPRFAVNGSRMTLLITVHDSQTGLILGGGSYLGTADFGLVNTARSAAADIGPQIRSAAAVSAPHPEPPRVLQQLSLYSADEGARVELGDNVPLGTIQDGTLQAPFLPFAVGSQLQLRTHLDGFHSAQQTILITDENMELQLPKLRPHVNWEMQLSWMTQRWAGLAIGVRRYLHHERVYLQSTNQVSSRYRFSAGSQPSGVFDTRLSLGGYPITALGGRLRLGLSSGGGLTFTGLRGEETSDYFTDPYLKPLSIMLRRQFERFALFVEGDLVYYGETKSGYLVRGTHGYLSLGVLTPWLP